MAHLLIFEFSLTEDYNLELQYRKPFLDVWEDEKNDRELGSLSERMGVRDRATGALMMTEEEKDAASQCSLAIHVFAFTDSPRFLSCILLLQGVKGLLSTRKLQTLRRNPYCLLYHRIEYEQYKSQVNPAATDAIPVNPVGADKLITPL